MDGHFLLGTINHQNGGLGTQRDQLADGLGSLASGSAFQVSAGEVEGNDHGGNSGKIVSRNFLDNQRQGAYCQRRDGTERDQHIHIRRAALDGPESRNIHMPGGKQHRDQRKCEHQPGIRHVSKYLATKEHMRNHQDHHQAGKDPADGHAPKSQMHLANLLILILMNAFPDAKAQICNAFEDKLLLQLTLIILHQGFFQSQVHMRGAHSIKRLQAVLHIRAARRAMHPVYADL